ncbi:DoxX family protein [Kribbella deserti]|uniref:DoxX family protein n=1 Tax=Kribbella deserti TaxID=1926257 RepID=A0ABV6QPV9_9ACTN
MSNRPLEKVSTGLRTVTAPNSGTEQSRASKTAQPSNGLANHALEHIGDIMETGQNTRTRTLLPGRGREGGLELILRVAVAAEFIGHGAFGIFGKEGWVAYYAALGIPESAAWVLMPITGGVDIILGLLVLAWPMRLPVAWMAFWGLFTATLRPLAGESIWEVVERSYNYGVPLLLLLVYGIGTATERRSLRHWLTVVREVPVITTAQKKKFAMLLRVVIGLYLIGHGALGLIAHKGLLLKGYASIGLNNLVDDPATLNTAIGSFEIVLGLLVLSYPHKAILAGVLVWKLATEMLYVTMGAYGAGFEVLERASSYAAPLALIYLTSRLGGKSASEPDEGKERQPAGRS